MVSKQKNAFRCKLLFHKASCRYRLKNGLHPLTRATELDSKLMPMEKSITNLSEKQHVTELCGQLVSAHASHSRYWLQMLAQGLAILTETF
jgi:hypothetical protein